MSSTKRRKGKSNLESVKRKKSDIGCEADAGDKGVKIKEKRIKEISNGFRALEGHRGTRGRLIDVRHGLVTRISIKGLTVPD